MLLLKIGQLIVHQEFRGLSPGSSICVTNYFMTQRLDSLCDVCGLWLLYAFLALTHQKSENLCMVMFVVSGIAIWHPVSLSQLNCVPLHVSSILS